MSTVLSLRSHAPGAVSARVEHLRGRDVVRVDVDGSNRRGALSASDGEAFAAAVDASLHAQLPLLAVLTSSGADVHEGVAALHGWGCTARALSRASGQIPLIAVLTGPAVSGPALLLGLADQVIFTPQAHAFVSGPRMVAQMTGTTIDAAALGGSAAHARHSGVASLVASNEVEAVDLAAELLEYLPSHTDHHAPRLRSQDPADRSTAEAADVLPATRSGSYDVRDVLGHLADHGEYLELRSEWAANLVTAFTRIGGHPVGIVANQPRTMAGTLDIAASQKGARFVSFCDTFNVALLTIVDTPGFFPGKDAEWRGMIRHGAQLAFAYARATVPRISLTLRKSYGGAYIVMDSKRMGSDLAFAWPSAEIAVMGAKGAAEILLRGAAPAERAQVEAAYEERLLNPYVAAERGLLDAVIDPADTRYELAAALDLLYAKRELLQPRGHDNHPL